MADADTAREEVTDYAESIADGRRRAGKWIYAACKRFLSDLERSDIWMDWGECARVFAHFERLSLVEDYADQNFALPPWQKWVVANLWGWRNTDNGRRRVTKAVVQIGRGNGKTTLMAGLALFDLLSGPGKRIYCIANKLDQAELLLDKAKQMVEKIPTDAKVKFWNIEREEADSEMRAVPSTAKSLDGLTPSMFIADEAAEYRDREPLAKLVTAAAKRKETLGVIISTPGRTIENVYGEEVARCERVLSGEEEDDSLIAILYGIDADDKLDDEEAWIKANPGLENGQPDSRSMKRAWTTAKGSALTRAEFSRYHCCRVSEESGGWLDMSCFPDPQEIEWSALRNRAAWAGLDLSKSFDMTALLVAVPLDDGRVALRGHYWLPAHEIVQRELDYRLPIRAWASAGKVTLTPGREVDYTAVLQKLKEINSEFQLQSVGYDRWGSKYFSEVAVAENIPLEAYSMGVSTYGPGCQLWQNLWVGKKLVMGDDPIMKAACRTAEAKRDSNGNITIDKRKRKSFVDALVAGVIAVHCWGGETRSVYEDL